jgi:hypothetical protein
VIPVILRPCDWEHSPFAHLLAAPTDGKPVTKWANEDEAFLDVVQKIRAALPANHRPELESSRSGSGAPGPVTVQSGPRSSNLRLRKTFTDADRDRFLDDAFAFMARFFENSLAELGKRNRNIEGRFRQLDGTGFTAVIYESGATRAQCTISLGGHFGRGISYSNSVGGSGNSCNEMLSVEHDEQHLYLKPMGMWLTGYERDAQLSGEGASEYFWAMLIEPLQH